MKCFTVRGTIEIMLFAETKEEAVRLANDKYFAEEVEQAIGHFVYDNVTARLSMRVAPTWAGCLPWNNDDDINAEEAVALNNIIVI